MGNKKSVSADEIAQHRLETQLDYLKKSKVAKAFGSFSLTVLFLFFTVFGILFFVLPKESFSENENRMLATFDQLTPSSLLDGSFSQKAASCISDHFPFRNAFFALQSYVSYAMTGEANGVCVSHGSLSKKAVLSKSSLDQLHSSVDSVKSLEEKFKKELGIDSLFVSVPLPCCAYQNRKDTDTAKYSSVFDTLKEADAFEFCEATQNIDNIFYTTDHHLNENGTYLLYLYLCDKLKTEAKNDFTLTCLSESFYGTTWSQSGLWATPPDKIYKFSCGADDVYTVSGDITVKSLYFTEKLETKDKYAYFLGGNYGRIEINSASDSPRPKLLLIKDSYANSLIPLLARHFDLTVIDPRYYRGDIVSEAQNAKNCLFLFGISSLMTDVGLAELDFNAESVK